MNMDISLYNDDMRFCLFCLDTDKEGKIMTTSSYGNFLSNIDGLCVPHDDAFSVCVWCLQRLRMCARLVEDRKKAQNLLKVYQTNCSLENISEFLWNEIQSLKMSKRFASQTILCSTITKATENATILKNCAEINVEQDWCADEINCEVDSAYESYENLENMQDKSTWDYEVYSKFMQNKSPDSESLKKYQDPLKHKRKKPKCTQRKFKINERTIVMHQTTENNDTGTLLKNEDPEYDSQDPRRYGPLCDGKAMQLKNVEKSINIEILDVQLEKIVDKNDLKNEKKSKTKVFATKQRYESGDKKARSFYKDEGKRKKISPYFKWSECRDYVELQPMTVAEQATVCEQRRRDAAYVAAPYKCDSCALAFAYTDSYTRHMQKHDSSYAPYKCPICEIYSRKTPANHAACVHRQRYVCSPCGFYARTRQVVIRHFLKSHSELILTCQVCRTVFKDFTKMRNHGTLAHNILPYSTQCVHCCKRMKNFRVLQQHLKLHNVDSENTGRQFECDYCKAQFSIKSQIYTHIQQLHSGGVNMCRLCGRIFKSETVLKQHNRRFHTDKNIKRYECDTCCKRFAVLSELRYHILWTHMRKGVTCPHCPKVFKTGYMQRAHIRSVHEHQKAAADKLCDICGKGFTAVSSLQRHKVLHTGERPYVCTLCPATFTQSSARTTHHRLVHLKLKRQRKPRLH